MISKRIFYVTYFADPFVQSCLDLIRYLGDWSERTPAHITIRGPYVRLLSKEVVADLNRVLEGAKIDVIGASAFLEFAQNTVYLSCFAPEIKAVWHKPGYPFNPHITLYDGDDRAFAEDLLAGIAPIAGAFPVAARGVDHILSVKGERVLPTTRLSVEPACMALGVDLQADLSVHSERSARLRQMVATYEALYGYCMSNGGASKDRALQIA